MNFTFKHFPIAEKMKKAFRKKPKFFLYTGTLFLSLFSAFIIQKKPIKESPLKEKTHNLDTFIPKGFVLVPIEVQNYKSLDSALGQYGIVDLYASTSSKPSNFKRIVKNIQIFRSPYPPYEFAVMAPEENAKFIMQIDGAIKVAIQNPKKNGMNFEFFFEKKEKPTKKVKRKLFIEF